MGSLTLIRLCRSGVDFGVLGVDLSWCDVVMSLLRLQQASDWIPHPYWMYTKCFGTLICCVWAYGATLTVMSLCRSGVDFGVLGGTPEPKTKSDVNVIVSKWRPQQASDWIPHPYWMYTKCFGTLICCLCIWVHPCSDTPLQVGLDFGILWVDCRPGVSRCDVIMSKLRLQQSSDWIPHPYWMYTKCFGTLICCL